MINLSTGANTVYATLREKKTLSNPAYVFVFVKEGTLKKYMVYNTDLSDTYYPRSKFIFTVQSNPTWYSGQLYPAEYGDFVYYVFECSDPLSLDYNTVVNADINDYIALGYFTSLLETGEMKYHPAASTNHVYKDVENIGRTYKTAS